MLFKYVEFDFIGSLVRFKKMQHNFYEFQYFYPDSVNNVACYTFAQRSAI